MDFDDLVEEMKKHFDFLEGNWFYGDHIGIHLFNSSCETEPKCEKVFVIKPKE